MTIIYEDKDILVVNKASGQLSQSGKGFDLDLVSEALNLRRSRGEEPYAAIINRLDRPVSGLVLLAKSKTAASKYSALMQKAGGFNKQYEALICGKLEQQSGELVDYIIHNKKDNTAIISAEGESEAKKACLKYEVLDYDEASDISRVRIHLITGRHHQIRVQFASRKHPLVGDSKYADGINVARVSSIKRNQIALCATSMEVDGKEFKVEAPF